MGFFALLAFLFPLVSILSQTKLFASLKKKIVAQEDLPSIKKAENWLPALLILIFYTLFNYFLFAKLYVYGYTSVFDSTYTYSPVNPFVYYFLVLTVIGIAITFITYAIKRFIHRKDEITVANPYELGKISGLGEFFKSCLFGIVVALFFMLPICIAFYCFQSSYRVWELAIYPDSIAHLFTFATKYLPWFVVFFIPMAISNASFRFKELPDWASALINGLTTTLGLIIFCIVFYTSGLNGAYSVPDGYGVMAGMVSITTPVMLIFASLLSRHVYKSTGNTWASAMASATVLGLMFFTYMSA